jgi:hypothetical protein
MRITIKGEIECGTGRVDYLVCTMNNEEMGSCLAQKMRRYLADDVAEAFRSASLVSLPAYTIPLD